MPVSSGHSCPLACGAEKASVGESARSFTKHRPRHTKPESSYNSLLAHHTDLMIQIHRNMICSKYDPAQYDLPYPTG